MGKTPLLNKQGLSVIRLPELSGGVNNTDSPSAIKDNQLQSENNMVYSAGAYKTRSGFVGTNTVIKNGKIATHHFKNGFPQYDGIQCVPHDIKFNYLLSGEYEYKNGAYASVDNSDKKIKGLYILHNYFRNTDIDPVNEYAIYGNINSYLYTEDGEFIPVYMDDRQEKAATHTDNNPGCWLFNIDLSYFTAYSAKPVIDGGLGVFMYIRGQSKHTAPKYTSQYRLYELAHIKDTEYKSDAETFENDGFHFAWVKVPEDKIYVPTVFINGKGDDYSLLPSDEDSSAPASNFESVNLLTQKVNAYFTTDGGYYPDVLGESEWQGSYSFTLPFIVDYVERKGIRTITNELKITYINHDGDEQVVTIAKDNNATIVKTGFYVTGYRPVDGYDGSGDIHLHVSIDWNDEENTTRISFDYNSALVAGDISWSLFRLPRVCTNNLKITAYVRTEDSNAKFSAFSQCTWFGGTSEGISGGTRMFMWGSKDEPNKIIFSDVDNPLYFPENNYICVGEHSDPVTILAKQSNMLIIAKRNSLHYTTYVDNSTSYTDKQIIDGNVYDAAAISAVFPITQISDEIGCDLPCTIQLCANDLVWANSDGRVYTLKSASQYSECNVYELSYPIQDIIRDTLKADKLWQAGGVQGCFGKDALLTRYCFAADYDGAYHLFINDKCFVMQYSDTGFKYSYTYAEGNRVKKDISWDVMDLSEFIKDDRENTFIYPRRAYNGNYFISNRLSFAISSANALYVIRDNIILGGTRYIATRVSQLLNLDKRNNDSGILNITAAGINDGTYNIELTEQESSQIIAEFTTKFFDLGQSFERKRIEHLYFSASGDIGTEIMVYAVTDSTNELIGSFFITEDNREKEYHIRHCIHGIKYLAIKAEIHGRAQIRGFAVKYKNLGGY